MPKGDEVNKWLAAAVAAAGLLGGPVVVWNALSNELTDTKRRVTQVEQRQDEDRRNVKETVQRIEERVQRVDDNVQTILRKIDVMEERNRRDDRRQQ